MRNCKYDKLIDEYLLNRLGQEQKQKFEEHYFNCLSCFEKLQAREELISIIKLKGAYVFEDIIDSRETRRITLWERLSSLLSQKQWTFTAASAVLILFLVIAFNPNKKTTAPEFQLDDPYLVRGKSITLISDAIPAQFKWESLGEDIEYQIMISDQNLFWKATTKNNYILLPEKIKSKMIPGVKYFWQVKAFSPEGTLIAQSIKVQLPGITQK